MKQIPVLILFLAATTAASFAQTPVDRLVRTLDSLSMAAIDHWKVSPDLKNYTPPSDPTRPGFDDSQWKDLRLNEELFIDSCWVRKEVVLPEKIFGTPLAGPMKLLLSNDDYGYLWINGSYIGPIPWSADFPLTNDAKPGQRFLLVVKVINTGGPLRLISAEIQTDKLRSLRSKLENFSLSIRTGQKLLGFETYQTNSTKRTDPKTDRSAMDRSEKIRLNEILQSSAASFDPQVIAAGPAERFDAMFGAVRNRLAPIAAYAKRFTLYFDANAHIDAAWLWRDKETVEICHNTFQSVFNMMDARPDFTYTQSSAAYYEWMEERYPALFEQIRKRVADGRWEAGGGMWIEPDCNLPSGDSWARQLLYAKKYFRKKLGVDVPFGWNPDSFGYNSSMPMLYRQAGIDAFITQKIGWNETNVFPYRLFWWESPDGSRVLSYFPFDYVNEVKNPFQLVDWMRQFEANTGMTKMMVLFGVGDHGGGPSMDMMDRIDRLRTLDIYPTIEYGNTVKYLTWLKAQDLSTVPVWKDELYLEYHQGTFTTQAAMKERNRASEVLLTNAEKLSAVASLFGRPYDRSALAAGWKNTMFNQFHDILPGSGIRENYIDANEKYDTVRTIATHEIAGSLRTIASQVNTSKLKNGRPVVVFNPLGWDRSDIVRVTLRREDDLHEAVVDARGNEVPSQIVPSGRYENELLFVATNVPSMGYATYEIRPVAANKAASPLAVGPSSMENQYFRVTLDPATGTVAHIVDKRNNREILSGQGNDLQLLEDRPAAWDAWNIGLTGTRYPSTFRRLEIVERGPVRIVVRAYVDYLKPGTKKEYPTEDFPTSFFTQDIILYDGLDRIDFVTSVDWWEEKTMLKVAFPVNVRDTVATFDVPFGTIQRSTQLRDSWEKARVEVPALTWTDISQSDYGVSLLTLSKYGYDVKGNTIRLSLLRSPKWPDPAADRGKHTIMYALYPHAGRWPQSQLMRRGYEFNAPLLSVVTDSHPGSLPLEHSFVRLEPANLVLTSVKKAEDSDEWVFQWFESLGLGTHATLTLPRTPKSAVRSNFIEEDAAPLSPSGDRLTVDSPHHAVVTVKVTY